MSNLFFIFVLSNTNNMKKPIYKTLFIVEVLSEEPIESTSFDELTRETTDGSWSGILSIKSSKTLRGKKAVEAIRNQGSDESFFFIDADGNELE